MGNSSEDKLGLRWRVINERPIENIILVNHGLLYQYFHPYLYIQCAKKPPPKGRASEGSVALVVNCSRCWKLVQGWQGSCPIGQAFEYKCMAIQIEAWS